MVYFAAILILIQLYCVFAVIIENFFFVCIRLPTKNGQLIYGSCTDTNEFWLAMVEKAYAKLHGSYEALISGHALEAFVDLTGGMAERMQISKGKV